MFVLSNLWNFSENNCSIKRVKGGQADVIYLYIFRKVLNKIPHGELLWKLNNHVMKSLLGLRNFGLNNSFSKAIDKILPEFYHFSLKIRAVFLNALLFSLLNKRCMHVDITSLQPFSLLHVFYICRVCMSRTWGSNNKRSQESLPLIGCWGTVYCSTLCWRIQQGKRQVFFTAWPEASESQSLIRMHNLFSIWK